MKMPGRKSVLEHEGKLPQPSSSAGQDSGFTPSRQSGGTSGDLSIPGWKTKTPIVTSSPTTSSPATSSPTRRKERPSKALESPKPKSTFSVPSVGDKVEQAKANVSKARADLFNIPQGSVTHSLLHGMEVHGLFHTPAEQTEIEQERGTPQGLLGRQATARKVRRETAAEPSTLEDLSIASIGAPGIGIGGGVAKVAELGAETVPKLLAEGGARQVAKDVGESVASKAAAKAAAVRAAPATAADALRSVPSALREAPAAARAAAKAAPEAARGAVRAAPASTGRFALHGTESNAKAFSGLGLATASNQVGVNPLGIPERGEALLKGTGQALSHNLSGTLKTTARSIPGLIAGPADVGIAAGESVAQGSPDPLIETSKSLAKGTAGMIGKLASGNPDTVQKTIENETGLTPYLPVPGAIAKLHSSDLYTAPRGAVRKGVENYRAGKRTTVDQGSGMRFRSKVSEGEPTTLMPQSATGGTLRNHPKDFTKKWDELGPDDYLWVFHSTPDSKFAGQLEREGTTPATFKGARNRGWTNKLYVTPFSHDLGPEFGKFRYALRVKKKDLLDVPPQGHGGFGVGGSMVRGEAVVGGRIAPDQVVRLDDTHPQAIASMLRDRGRAKATAIGKFSNGPMKPPVPVRGRPGEHFVFGELGKKINARQARKDVALDTTRMGTYGETHGTLEAQRIVKAARGVDGISRLASKMGPEYEAAMWPMAKFGLPHTREGYDLGRQLSEYFGDPEGPPVPGSLTDRMAINGAIDNHHIFVNKRHAAMTEEYRAGADRLAKLNSHSSRRAARIPQNDFTNYLRAKEDLPPVLKPEERITPRAHDFTSPKEASDALRAEAGELRKSAAKSKSEKNAKALLAEASRKETHAGHLIQGDMVSREGAHAHYDQLNAEAEKLRQEGRLEARKGVVKQKKALYGELKDYTFPHHKLDTSKRKLASKGMTNEFVREQDAVAKAYGMHQGVYVADKAPLSATQKGTVVERPFSSRATHVKTGVLAKSGEADARFEAGINHSVLGPRQRMAYNQLVTSTLNENKLPVRVGDTVKHVLSERELEHAARTNQLPADSVAVDVGVIKSALTGEHALNHEAVTSLLKAVTHGEGAEDALKNLPEDLKTEILSARGKGRKYAVVSKPALQELVDQFATPKHPNWRKAANAPTRLLLNDPAWVFSQIFATGIPMGAALGPSTLLHAPMAIKVMADIQKMDPEKQARIVSMVGSSSGLMGTPQGAFAAARDPFSNIRAIRRSSTGKKLWNLANGEVMSKWDRWNAAKMREYAAAVRANKGFRNWYGGFKGLDGNIRKIAEATKGMKATERLDYISRHPQLARNLQRDLDNIGGNWNSFTALERKIAPFAVFYPWIRYSLNWVFHTFPLSHPVAVTALAMLGQQNANELQKLAAQNDPSGKVTPTTGLADPLDYGYNVTQSGGKSHASPVGSRISPALGVAGNFLTTGKPISLLGGMNPILGTGVSLATNTNLFTGEKLTGSIPNELANQALSLSPAARLGESLLHFRGFGKGPQSATSKGYEETNPNKAVRAAIWPFLQQSSKNFGAENALSRVEEIISKTSAEKQKEVQGDDTKTIPQREKIIAAMKKEEGAALDARDKILKGIGGKPLLKQSEEEYERYKAAGGAGGGFSLGGSEKGFKISESGGGFSLGGANEKARQYKPPSEGLNLPSVSLPGLGKVTGTIGSLVGGTAAQAAALHNPATATISSTGKPQAGQVPQKQRFASLAPAEKKVAPTVEEAAQKYGLKPSLLMAQLKQESGFNPAAVSSAGAQGISQFLPSTAESYGVKFGTGKQEVRSQIFGQAKLMSSNLKETGNYTEALNNYLGLHGQTSPSEYSSNILSMAKGYAGLDSGVAAKAPKKVVSRFEAGRQAAEELAHSHIPYVWGGGHASYGTFNPRGGLDCSGAVSYVLHKMGVLKEPLSSSYMGQVLKPGPGAVTVFYNADHTFMKIGEKYFGTSVDDSSKGLSFYKAPPQSYLSEFSVGHVAGLGKKEALQLGIKPTGGGSFPGMSVSSNGTTATILPGAGTTQTKAGFSNKPIRGQTALQKLRLVEQIESGNLKGLGVPSSSKPGSQVDLAAIGRAVEESRRKLLAA